MPKLRNGNNGDSNPGSLDCESGILPTELPRSTFRLEPEHTEFTNFMNKHCSDWSSNDRIYQSHISTICGQYCVAFLMFRCRNVSMHAFSRLFTTDLVANECRMFNWLGAEYAL